VSRLVIAEEFSATPKGRTPNDGPDSGLRFRQQYLAPRLKAATPSDRLEVVLDGVITLDPEFIEEAFVGLVRDDGFTLEQVTSIMSIRGSLPVHKLYIGLIAKYLDDVRPD
jgi:hypothetical protein